MNNTPVYWQFVDNELTGTFTLDELRREFRDFVPSQVEKMVKLLSSGFSVRSNTFWIIPKPSLPEEKVIALELGGGVTEGVYQ